MPSKGGAFEWHSENGNAVSSSFRLRHIGTGLYLAAVPIVAALSSLSNALALSGKPTVNGSTSRVSLGTRLELAPFTPTTPHVPPPASGKTFATSGDRDGEVKSEKKPSAAVAVAAPAVTGTVDDSVVRLHSLCRGCSCLCS